MPKLMGDVMDFNDVGKRELCEHECDPHAFTRTRTHKGGWFGLTQGFALFGLSRRFLFLRV